MVIKEKKWIGTHRGDMVAHNPSCDKIITMVIMFLGFNAYNPITISS